MSLSCVRSCRSDTIGAGGGIRTRTDGHLKTVPLPLGYAGLGLHRSCAAYDTQRPQSRALESAIAPTSPDTAAVSLPVPSLLVPFLIAVAVLTVTPGPD